MVRKKTPAELRAALRAQTQEDIASAVRAGNATLDEAVKATNVAMEAIDARIVAIEENARRQDLPGSGDDGRGDEYEGRFDFGNVFRSLILKAANEPEARWRGAAEAEWEMCDQLRAQATTPDSAGGFLVPGQVLVDQVIPLLRPRLIATMLGATEADFTSTPVDIPREVTDPTTEALAENATQTASNAVLGNMRLEPHRAQAYIEASRRLFDLGPGAQKIIVNMMTRRLAITINGWALNGTGGLEPTGIINTPGIGSVAFGGAAPTAAVVVYEHYTDLQMFEEALGLADALEGAGSLGWALPIKAVRMLRSIQSEDTAADGVQLAANTVHDAVSQTVFGHKYATSTQLSDGAESEIIFGDWEMLIMATFGNMILETSNVAGEAMRQGQTHIVTAMEVDTAVTQPGAFAISTGLDLSGF